MKIPVLCCVNTGGMQIWLEGANSKHDIKTIHGRLLSIGMTWDIVVKHSGATDDIEWTWGIHS